MIRKLKTPLYHSGAILIALLVAIPFFWMISTSLKSRGALMVLPIEWIPGEPTFSSYIELFAKDGFVHSLVNSMIVAVCSVIITLVSSAMAAFVFSKIEFKGRDIIFLFYLATMMIPSQVLFIPLFLLMSEFGLTDTLAALVLPTVFKAFAIFMLRQQMMAIPKAYMEAPLIDGAGLWKTFIYVICPMCKPTFATLAVISFMESWNDFLLPLVLLSTKTKYTLPVILNSLNGQYANEYNLLMAGALVSMIPVLILYAFAQKQFTAGFQIGGIKG